MNSIQANGSTSSSADQNSTRIIIHFTLLALIALLIITINSLVIIMVYRKQFLRTVTNFCLASLACSDLLSGLFIIPLIIICSLTKKFKVCVAMDCSQRFLATSTIIHLLLITLERYYTIIYSTTYAGSAVSKRLCRVSLFSIWIFSLGVSLIQLSWIKMRPSPDISKIEITYGAVTLAVIVLAPLTIMIFCYTHIFLTLKRHVAQISQDVVHVNIESEHRHRRKERTALLIFVAMIVVFVIGWFSYFFNGLQWDLGHRYAFPFWADTFLLLLRFSTSLLNPILYTFLKQDFRRASRSLLESVNNSVITGYSSTNRKLFDISDIRAKRGGFTIKKSKDSYKVQETNTQLTGASVRDSQKSSVLSTIRINNHECSLLELHALPSHVKNPLQKQGKSEAWDTNIPTNENYLLDQGQVSLDIETLQDPTIPKGETVSYNALKEANHSIVRERAESIISDYEKQNGECCTVNQVSVSLDCRM